MSVSFNILGENIEIHESLLTYYNALKLFKEQCGYTTTRISGYVSKAKFEDQTEKEWGMIHEDVDGFIQTLILLLSNFKIFDVTKDTFMKDNKGEIAIGEAHRGYLNERLNQMRTMLQNSIVDEQYARIQANSQIRGLDFGVITGSITGAIVYDMMNQKEIEKQTRAANSYYQAAVKDSMNRHQTIADLELRRYYYEKFYPELLAAISLLYQDIFQRYIALLCNIGVIETKCIDSLDEQKAIQIMENIGMQTEANKPKVFAVAVGFCPYSAEVYRLGYKNYLSKIKRTLKEVCGDLIHYFGLETELHDIWVSVDTLCDEAKTQLLKKNYDGAEKLYSQIKDLYPKDYRGYLGMLLVETWGFTKQTADLARAEVLYNCVLRMNPNAEKNAILTEYFTQYEKTVNYLRNNKDVHETSANTATWRAMEQKSRVKRKFTWSAVLLVIFILLLIWTIASPQTEKSVITFFCVISFCITLMVFVFAIADATAINKLNQIADEEKAKLEDKNKVVHRLREEKDIAVLFEK